MSINKRGLAHCVTFSPGSKFLIVAVLLAVSAAIFLCPLYIQTQCPCLTKQLPRKPDLIGHRGAPMVSITMFSTTPRGHTRRRPPFCYYNPTTASNMEEAIYMTTYLFDKLENCTLLLEWKIYNK